MLCCTDITPDMIIRLASVENVESREALCLPFIDFSNPEIQELSEKLKFDYIEYKKNNRKDEIKQAIIEEFGKDYNKLADLVEIKLEQQ